MFVNELCCLSVLPFALPFVDLLHFTGPGFLRLAWFSEDAGWTEGERQTEVANGPASQRLRLHASGDTDPIWAHIGHMWGGGRWGQL